MDDSPRKNRVVLTVAGKESNIPPTSSKSRQQQNVAQQLLAPLRAGKPVMIVVDDPRMPKRKRANEKRKLFLTPLTVYGRLSSKIMVALEAEGCEVIDTMEPIQPMALYRLGLNLRLSRELATELNLVFTKRR